jgi:hypothetical protein
MIICLHESHEHRPDRKLAAPGAPGQIAQIAAGGRYQIRSLDDASHSNCGTFLPHCIGGFLIGRRADTQHRADHHSCGHELTSMCNAATRPIVSNLRASSKNHSKRNALICSSFAFVPPWSHPSQGTGCAFGNGQLCDLQDAADQGMVSTPSALACSLHTNVRILD